MASTFLRVRVLLAVVTGVFVYAGISIANQLGVGDGTYAVAAGVLLGALQLIPELGFLLGFVALLIPLAIGGPVAAGAFALVYVGSVKAASTLLEGPAEPGRPRRPPRPAHPRPSWSSASSASSGCFAAAPFVAIVRDLVRYANVRLADPPGPAGVLPGEKVRGTRAGRAAQAGPSVYRAPAPAAPAIVSATVRRSAAAPVALVARRPCAAGTSLGRQQPARAEAPSQPSTRTSSPGPGPARPPSPRGAPSRERRSRPQMDATLADEASALAQSYIQLTEAEASPLDAADAIERRDSYGRVPVLVRIRRQPPINPVWLLVAIGLAASGLFLPLAAALRAVIIVAAVVALIVGIISRLIIRVPSGLRRPGRQGRPPRPRPHGGQPLGHARSSPCRTWSPRARSRSTSRSTRCAPRTASAWRWTCSSPCGSRTP